ncbi:MAG: hypothetical protein ABEH58_08800 [Haloplanus sp.]
MGNESTQMDLSAELDRLSAMRGDDGEDAGVRIEILDAVVEPDGVDGHRMVGLTVAADGDAASLRGSRWRHPLHHLHREDVRPTVDGTPVGVVRALDAVGGADLDGGYVLDRATYVIWAVDGAHGGSAVRLRAIDAPPAADTTVDETRTVEVSTLETASRPGFDDADRYRTFDPVGRPLDPPALVP